MPIGVAMTNYEQIQLGNTEHLILTCISMTQTTPQSISFTRTCVGEDQMKHSPCSRAINHFRGQDYRIHSNSSALDVSKT